MTPQDGAVREMIMIVNTTTIQKARPLSTCDFLLWSYKIRQPFASLSYLQSQLGLICSGMARTLKMHIVCNLLF